MASKSNKIYEQLTFFLVGIKL